MGIVQNVGGLPDGWREVRQTVFLLMAALRGQIRAAVKARFLVRRENKELLCFSDRNNQAT